MNVDIRDATVSDSNAISELVSSLASEHIADSLGDGGLESLLASMDNASTTRRISDGWLHVVAINCNELCAVAVVKPPQHLYHLFVRSDLQRTGLGAKLLNHTDARVRRLTSSRLATVNSSLNAVGFYKRFGFVLDGDVEDIGGVRFQPMRRDEDGELLSRDAAFPQMPS